MDLTAWIRRVDEQSIRRTLFFLAQDPLPRRTANFTRPGQSKSTLEEADDYIESRLREWGWAVSLEAVQAQAFRRDTSKPLAHQYSSPLPDDPWFTLHNLHARKSGAERPDEVILLFAHKDSQSWIDSPGAYDNASGTAGLMEIARLLGPRESRRSIWLLFCNEEHRPWTSVQAAQRMREEGVGILAGFNLDSLGTKSAEAARAGLQGATTLYTAEEGRPIAELMDRLNTRLAIGLEHKIRQNAKPMNDDGSFIKAGFAPIVMCVGPGPQEEPNYHTPGDKPENVDTANVARQVQLCLAAVLELDEKGPAALDMR